MGEEVLANHFGRRAAAPAAVMQPSAEANERPGSWPNIGQLVAVQVPPGRAGRVGSAWAAVRVAGPPTATATRPMVTAMRARARDHAQDLRPDICPSR